jgi:hypothetical protein
VKVRRGSGSELTDTAGLVGIGTTIGVPADEILNHVPLDVVLSVFQELRPGANLVDLEHNEDGSWTHRSKGGRRRPLVLSETYIASRVNTMRSEDGAMRMQVVESFVAADLEYIANDAFLSMGLSLSDLRRLYRKSTTLGGRRASATSGVRRTQRRVAAARSSSRDDGDSQPPAPSSSSPPCCWADGDQDRPGSTPQPDPLAGTELVEVGATLIPRRVFVDSSDVVIARGGAS